MDNEDLNDALADALAASLEGNALKLQDVINGVLDAKAIDSISSMKVDVAQSVYGNYAHDDVDPNDTEEGSDDDDIDFESEDDIEDLFAELEDLTDDSEDEDGTEDETYETEDDPDV